MKMFKDASRSKVLELRAREDNPATDVQGPDRGAERSGPYVLPSEFEALMACGRIPSRWKRLVVFAVYLGLRRGELAVLEWGDVSIALSSESSTRRSREPITATFIRHLREKTLPEFVSNPNQTRGDWPDERAAVAVSATASTTALLTS